MSLSFGSAMPHSPGGHRIEALDGDPVQIWAHGVRIETVGQKMIAAATTLDRVANDDGRGESMDALREEIDGLQTVLKQAGETYSGVGPVLQGYARAIDSPQPQIDMSVSYCESAWAEYLANRPSPIALPGAEDDEASLLAAQRAEEALARFEMNARAFDADRDVWEKAFMDAANDISEFVEDGVKDGFWDNVDGSVEFLQAALTVTGIALVVLCAVVGGPVLAAIAVAVGVAGLLLTAYQKVRGDAEWADIGWAVLAILPLGKLKILSKGLFKASVVSGKGFYRGMKAAKPFNAVVRSIRSPIAAATRGGTRPNPLYDIFIDNSKQVAKNDWAFRLFTGANKSEVGKNLEWVGGVVNTWKGHALTGRDLLQNFSPDAQPDRSSVRQSDPDGPEWESLQPWRQSAPLKR